MQQATTQLLTMDNPSMLPSVLIFTPEVGREAAVAEEVGMLTVLPFSIVMPVTSTLLSSRMTSELPCASRITSAGLPVAPIRTIGSVGEAEPKSATGSVNK